MSGTGSGFPLGIDRSAIMCIVALGLTNSFKEAIVSLSSESMGHFADVQFRNCQPLWNFPVGRGRGGRGGGEKESSMRVL